MSANIDTKVSNYSISELMAIVELQDLKPNEIVKQTNKYINKFKTSNPTLSTFFMEIRSQLLQYSTNLVDPKNKAASFVEGFTSINDEEDEDEEKAEDAEYPEGEKQQTNWYENQALPQDDDEDENQKDKTTERKQQRKLKKNVQRELKEQAVFIKNSMINEVVIDENNIYNSCKSINTV